jgi:DNA invertase Pin-like site-specific DNA recombinase
MVFTILGSVAELERSLIVERVKAGLRNARAKGKRLGRPRLLLDVSKIGRLRSQGRSWRKIARIMECSSKTARRVWQKSTSECFCGAADEKEKTPMPAAPQASEYTEARL